MSEPDPSSRVQRSPLMGLIDRVAELIGARNDEGSLRESLEEVIEEHEDDTDALSAEERVMLMNILALGELRVEDVMVPRADIVAIEIDTPLADTVRLFRDAKHSRLPVYRETLDDPLGSVHLKDLIAWWPLEGDNSQGIFSLEAIRRDVMFVPPSMPVLDLLLRMRTTGNHLALVVDEYGGTDGLVTIADLVEQIVGELEHDEDDAPTIEPVEGGYLVDARAPIEEVEDLTGLTLVGEDLEEEIDTIGGLVASLVGRVPIKGEIIEHPAGIVFEVVDADPRRVKRARLILPKGEEPADDVS